MNTPNTYLFDGEYLHLRVHLDDASGHYAYDACIKAYYIHESLFVYSDPLEAWSAGIRHISDLIDDEYPECRFEYKRLVSLTRLHVENY